MRARIFFRELSGFCKTGDERHALRALPDQRASGLRALPAQAELADVAAGRNLHDHDARRDVGPAAAAGSAGGQAWTQFHCRK